MLTAQIAPAGADMPAASPGPGSIDPAVMKRIQNALKQNQLALVVQPISELVGEPHKKPSSKLDIYVMLKDSEGELPASKFIREARASGLIRFVDRWVVHNVCRVLHSNLQMEGPVLLFLRLSRQSLHDPTLVYSLKQEVNKQGIPPDCLSFELIEADLTDLSDDEFRVLQEMKQAGFLLSVSGFGSSPASLQHLQRLPLDFVKLDPKLAEKVQHSENAKKFVQEIVQAANATHTGVVATQVPNAMAMATLWTLGVHYVQGNYLQEPEIVLQHS
jgi:EAL domain-containing protein (putative c-di-GMP-specific phosphodiesterase class I)